MTGWLPCRRAPCRAALAVTAALIGSVLLPQGAAAGQSGYDYDCTDFDTRAEAQAFYEENGGPLYDPFNLDDDGDGVACEEWRRDYQETRRGEDGVNGQDGIDRDCADFDSEDAALRYFLTDGGSAGVNIDHLDPNHNGIACENGEPG